MKLDLVHDIQGAYRKILSSMARPGIIENLENEAIKVEMNINFYKSTFLIMLMLLDREVSFNVISKDSISISGLISQITYAKVKPVCEADYLFVLSDFCDEMLEVVFDNAKIGDLINPNKSATIVAEFDGIKNYCNLEFTGPGIKEVNEVYISGNLNWIKARTLKNEEYPMGIDMICLDKDSNVLCIPRTTSILEKGDN